MRYALSLLLMLACAPTAHTLVEPGAALSTQSAAATRSPVASVLMTDDPLAVGPQPPAELPSPRQGPPVAPPVSVTVIEPPVAVPVKPHLHVAMKKDAGVSQAGDGKVLDPVCGMRIDPATAKGGSVMHKGKTVHFCSSSCKRRYVAQIDGGTP
jgi:YHS domain-containing protein